MKKIAVLTCFLLFAAVVSLKAQDRPHHDHDRDHDRGHRGDRDRRDGGGGVNAPLDGGLLLVLGGAGVAYLVARKKRENS